MTFHRLLLSAISLGTVALLGCVPTNAPIQSAPPPTAPTYSQAPPPYSDPQPAYRDPQPAYREPPPRDVPPLVQLAERNGFLTGRSDGHRDVLGRLPYSARSTRAYHDTPGYDPQLGPFEAYRNAFRNAYLQGYDEGFYRP